MSKMTPITIDKRIGTLIEDGVTCGYRTMFVIVGDKAKDQVVILHHLLSRFLVGTQPTVLWCYKNDLGYGSGRNKNIKVLLKKAKSGKLDFSNDDPFGLFILSANIRYCYYTETHKILGSTYDMCIIQDFEALTPNLLARTLETVQGGGIIVFLLQNMSSLKQLYTMNMDVHQKFRTEAHQNVECRFNERFLLSLRDCQRCLVVNDQLEALPISFQNLDIKTSQETNTINTTELETLKNNFKDTKPTGVIINCCRTTDQAKALLKFIDAISEKSMKLTISLTAARGRGKSATLGLAIAGAIAFGYSNIYITSPSPENLRTVFEFILKGLEALNYNEHKDYNSLQSSNPEFNEATIQISIFKHHRQTIQYIHPMDAKGKLGLAELLVIDEAAAIPLPHVKAMLGPYLTFMASTINGYEGTGRSLTLKLLQQLREQPIQSNLNNKQEKDLSEKIIINRELQEFTLEEPIRYKAGDCIEKWLCDLLCLNATSSITSMSFGYPTPEDCQLYYVNKDTLFSYHKASELFLQQMMGLYVSSHYKNSPNDLQMMCDAPAHHLFCLLGPIDPNTKTVPEILVVLQVCLEGRISKSIISDGLRRGQRASGDLIPWTVAQQFQDEDFPLLSGARIVRIATHPNYQGMGYGIRALNLLRQYYQSYISNSKTKRAKTTDTKQTEASQKQKTNLLEEKIEPRNSLPPLLLQLSERCPERLDYLGVSFGLTEALLKFWKRAKYVPVYLRQTPNEITGEHSCIMLSSLQETPVDWLEVYWKDFRRRFITLLSTAFRDYPPYFALAILTNNTLKVPHETLQKNVLDVYFTSYDIKRLDKYSHNMSNYHLIMDLVPPLARLYYLNLMGSVHFSPVQSALLLGLGLQCKTVDQLIDDLNNYSTNDANTLESSQAFGLFNRVISKGTKYLNKIVYNSVGNSHNENRNSELTEINLKNRKDTKRELETANIELKKKRNKKFKKLKQTPMEQFAVEENEIACSNALESSKNNQNFSPVKSFDRQVASNENDTNFEEKQLKKKKKAKKRKHSL